VERYAQAANVAVIMPEVQRSFYCDTVSGMAYFRYVSQELPQMCKHFFNLSTDPELSYIMGLSMGGFGALKCALNYPNRYAGCGSFSGVTDLDAFLHRQALPMRGEEFTALLGPEHKVEKENDLTALAREVKDPPFLYLSCGEQDVHYPMNCAFAEELTRLKIPHRFDHRTGEHSWDFWDQSIRDCFQCLFA
jgi:S-formylglutathione hydrolase FrmB